MEIGIVVPVYNEGRIIFDVLRSMPKSVKTITIVDDSSTDNTTSYIKTFRKSKFCDKRFHFLFLKKNLGVGGATLIGFYHTLNLGADIIIKMDGDGQMSPKYIYSLADPILNNKADLTKGNRLYSIRSMKNIPKIRLFGNIFLSFLTALSMRSLNVIDSQNGFIAVSSKLLKVIDVSNLCSDFAFENSFLIEANRKKAIILPIPIPAIYGSEKSHIRITNFVFSFLRFLLYNAFGLTNGFSKQNLT